MQAACMLNSFNKHQAGYRAASKRDVSKIQFRDSFYSNKQSKWLKGTTRLVTKI